MRKYLLQIEMIIDAEDSEEAVVQVRETLSEMGEVAVASLIDEGGEETIIDGRIPWPREAG